MNIFDVLNSQYVTQSHYDTILSQQKAYLEFINNLLKSPINIDWLKCRDAGILDLCYNYFKDFAKENKLMDIQLVQKLQDSMMEQEGKLNYVADFIKFMGINTMNQEVFDQMGKVLLSYDLEYDLGQRQQFFEYLQFEQQYEIIVIEIMRKYADQVYNEEGYLNVLLEFGAALESIYPIPTNIVQEVHSERSIKNIFEAILYYPDTHDHLQEFKQSMEITKMYAEMDNTLQIAMKKRLLISGINTETILKFYINLLKVLQFVDADCLIFESVTKKIKEYLLQRSDFLRCIIAILTEHNYKADRVMVYEQQDSSDDECAQEKDLTSVLVSLYGSQEAFISEYQNMVAEKILTPKEFNLQQEFANIELMKIRFGEQAMQTCTIMMKDIYESKRIDSNLQEQQFALLHPLFLSKTFWPISYEFKPTFKLPNHIETLFEAYQKKFEKVKTMRTLLWHHDLGSVTLSLSFDNGDFEFKCLPVHAAIIGFFNDVEHPLSGDQLSLQLQMSHEDLRRRMQFWIQKGVIKEQKDMYEAVSVFKPQQCDDQLIEEIPEDLFVSSTTFLQSNQLIQQISHSLLELLKQTGSLKLEKIVQLFKNTFKGEFGMPITENNIKEAIKILLQKGKLNNANEYIELK